MKNFERGRDPKKVMKIGQASKPVSIFHKFQEIPKKYKLRIREDNTNERQIVFMIDGKRFDKFDKIEYGFSLSGEFSKPYGETNVLIWFTGPTMVETFVLPLEWDTDMDEALQELRHQALTAIYRKAGSNM